MDLDKEAAEGVIPALNSNYEEVEHVEADMAAGKQLMRKIDFKVIPILIILFTFSLIDRNIIATARVAGMGKDLNLVGSRYSVALLVLFPLYILVELPSSFILRKVSVRGFFFATVFCWGIVAMCHAFVNSFAQLVAVRALLGLFEGSFQVSALI
jgi:MFS family permease